MFKEKDKVNDFIGRRFLSRRFIYVGVGCLIGLLLFFGWIYFREYRAMQLAHSAVQHISNSQSADWIKGWEEIRAAEYLDPDNLFVLRTAGRIGEQMEPEKAYAFWVRAEVLSGGAREDVEGAIRAALAGGMLDEASYKLNQYKAGWEANNKYWYWQSIWYEKKGLTEQSIEAARKLMELSDQFGDKWYYIQLLLNAPLYREQLKGRKLIFMMIEENRYPEYQIKMAQRALEIPDLSADEKRILERVFHASESRDDQLSAYAIYLEENEMEQTLFDEIASLFDLSQSIERLELGRWLNSVELYEYTLEVISEADSLRHKDLFLVRLDALALLDRWDELQSLLSRKAVPLEGYWQALFRMRAAVEQADSRRADIEWKRALLAAGRDERILLFQVRYTKALGLEKYTIEALEKMTESTLARRKGYEALLILRQRNMDTEGVRDTLERMRVVYPNDFSVANDLAYYNLLLNEQIPESKALLIQLMEDNPDLLSHRMSVILAFIREGDPESAFAIMKATPVDWKKISNRWKIPAAVTLYENGYVDAAHELVQDLDLKQFLKEEELLLQPVLDSLK